MQTKGMDSGANHTQRMLHPPGGENNETAVGNLRRRYVQAELQLRECEDRFRRDCARQEQELELIQFENNKLKMRIEELRMAENALGNEQTPRSDSGGVDAGEHDSKLLKASSQKYRLSREAVEKARQELSDLETQVTAARVRFNELRHRHGSTSSAANAIWVQTYRNRRNEEEQMEASRARLRGLESHVVSEADRLANLLEQGKTMRMEIDLQITMQNQVEELRQDREGEMVEIMKETSFLIEVCNLLVEERSECEHRLIELRQAAQADAEAYEKAFDELVGVEERSKTQLQSLHDNIEKLTNELSEVVRERQIAENELKLRHSESNAVDESDDGGDDDGLKGQLKEFEVYLDRLAKFVGVCDLDEVERYVCDENGERFQLYNVIQNMQSVSRNLEKERNELRKTLNTLIEGTKKERQEREEISKLQKTLKDLQDETQGIEERSRKTRAILAESVIHVEKMFTAIGCTAPKLMLMKGGSTPSLHSVHQLFAAVERRTEDYMTVWAQQDRNANQTLLPPAPLHRPPSAKAPVPLTKLGKTLPLIGGDEHDAGMSGELLESNDPSALPEDDGIPGGDGVAYPPTARGQ